MGEEEGDIIMENRERKTVLNVMTALHRLKKKRPRTYSENKAMLTNYIKANQNRNAHDPAIYNKNRKRNVVFIHLLETSHEPITMPPQTDLSRRGFYVEHHQYKSCGQLDQ